MVFYKITPSSYLIDFSFSGKQSNTENNDFVQNILQIFYVHALLGVVAPAKGVLQETLLIIFL